MATEARLAGDLYLVVARFGLDDIPLRLCTSREEAVEWLETPDAVREADWTAGNCGISDTWSVCAFSVCRFEDGVLCSIDVVRGVADDEHEDARATGDDSDGGDEA